MPPCAPLRGKMGGGQVPSIYRPCFGLDLFEYKRAYTAGLKNRMRVFFRIFTQNYRIQLFNKASI